MKFPTAPLLALALVPLLTLAASTSSLAQAPIPIAGELLPVEIGHATGKGAGGDPAATYQVFATAALDSTEKGQRVQFVTRQSGGGRSTTAYTVVNTGKSKTLGQLAEKLGDGMRRFAAAGGTVGQEFARVGDLRYGGELRLVALDADSLRFEYNPPTARPVTFTRADCAAFAGILGR